MLRALIFDFDGLIIDTETPIIEAYREVHRLHGKSFERTLFMRNIGHAEYGFNPWEAFGTGADSTALEEQRRLINRALTLEQPILPGVKETLEAAKQAGLRLGVASNSSHEWVEPHLQRLGLHPYFSQFSCRGDTHSPKPEPDIYRHAVNGLGLRAMEAVALEDSMTGLLAAKRANLFTVGIPNISTLHHDLSMADYLLSSMADLDLTLLAKRVAARQ